MSKEESKSQPKDGNKGSGSESSIANKGGAHMSSGNEPAPFGWDQSKEKREEVLLLSRQKIIKSNNITNVISIEGSIGNRYSIIETLGEGAYGLVCCAKDMVDGKLVALKKIEYPHGDELFTKRTLREIRILRLLKHENIIGLKSIIRPTESDVLNELYIVFELMETDLASIIKSPQPLSDGHVQFFLYQILRGLKYIHSADIIHRDLKPKNLLVNSNCDLKICDFGLARIDLSSWPTPSSIIERKSDLSTLSISVPDINLVASSSASSAAASSSSSTATMPSASNVLHTKKQQMHAGDMTDYVATRWYRAPEILFECDMGYSKSVDIWAVGCILAELLLRKPIFPGSDLQNQIHKIGKRLGRPPDSLILRTKSKPIEQSLRIIPQKPAKPLAHSFKHANIQAIDMLMHLLVYDPHKRYSVSDGLKHPYLSALHFPDDEPLFPAKIPVEEFAFELQPNLGLEYFKSLISEEVDRFSPKVHQAQAHPYSATFVGEDNLQESTASIEGNFEHIGLNSSGSGSLADMIAASRGSNTGSDQSNKNQNDKLSLPSSNHNSSVGVIDLGSQSGVFDDLPLKFHSSGSFGGMSSDILPMPPAQQQAAVTSALSPHALERRKQQHSRQS